MVRLKAAKDPLARLQLAGFNSNMVRLKDEDRVARQGKKRFQFQYGSIKRDLPAYEPHAGREFQFQYGSIKSCR